MDMFKDIQSGRSGSVPQAPAGLSLKPGFALLSLSAHVSP